MSYNTSSSTSGYGYFGSPKGDPNVYFAAAEQTDVASNLLSKGRSFFNLLASNAYLNKLRNMWYFYHGMFNQNSHEVSFTGEQGELVNLPVNHFRNIARHMHTMVTQNRPIMEARAINTDYKSLAQTYLANGILDYYMREKGLENCLKKACEMAIVLGSGFIKMEWNATAGETYDVDPETGEFNYEGEIEFSNLTPLDVVVDGTKEAWSNEWILIRTFKNKFNLMAKYPELAEKIKGMNPKDFNSIYRLSIFSNDDTDDIPVYEFYHKRTEAMPDGRYMLFVDSDAILLDVKMPYRTIPIFRIAAGEILGTPYGYSDMFDVYPLQEAINSLYSAALTNNNAFAVQSIYIPRGADISYASVEGGMNIIEGNAKPEPIQLTQTPAELFTLLSTLIQASETLSGINSVARGNPEASLKSGAALALVQSMALQFISGLQQSYVKLIEDVGTALIQILKDFAHTPKLVALVGRNNRPMLKEFTGEQISAINRVIVDVGNPLSRTIAGRVQMAEQLAQMKLLKNPEQYFQVMNTGRLDVTFEGEMNELLLVKQENEYLMDGQQVIASVLDKHRMHILEHKSVISGPELRNDPDLLANTHDHIKQHIDLLRNGDPDLLQLIGEQPLNDPYAAGEDKLPPGPMGAPANPMNNKQVLESSTMGDVEGTQPNNQIRQPGGTRESLPNIPKPPGQFKNLPTDPSQMIPG